MEERRYSIGSLFSGIGGFELGLERAIPGSYTRWQVEKDIKCHRILRKHWPAARIYNQVEEIKQENVERVDIICGGFPCQDISSSGKKEGLNGTRSNLWWEMHRIIGELRPRIAVMENVSSISVRGLGGVIGSLSEIGYDAEWCNIRASDFGAPHQRSRWFCVAYPRRRVSSNPNEERTKISLERQYPSLEESRSSSEKGRALQYWRERFVKSRICRMDDGVPNRVDRINQLGNAIVPQCSEWIGKKIWESGLLLD